MNSIDYKLLEILATDPDNFPDFERESIYTPGFCERVNILSKQFHLIMQQIGMGLSVEPLLDNSPQLKAWVEKVQPIISTPAIAKSWNVSLQKPIDNNLLVAQYDLILEREERLIAIDWSVQHRPVSYQQLLESWQTQLRLFLLLENSSFAPEQIGISYLLVNAKSAPIYHFEYSRQQHEEFQQKLAGILSKLPETEKNVSPAALSEFDRDPSELNLKKFLNGELTTQEYLATVPEVEI
ncbi:PD-(D/E)XK nuclease family protein [Chroococcidiopsis sp. FACHB-1243]|uniref:PD-(D/E)XK nuclease family protein n=1 Tax=Chroococcidiopsis sp. [FACHB-1243] TaxID=2692781 RepID=UPI00177E7419|nr:PD-(D/E)XK nuclease family protein [Chroococcidiopsis sp. [FACHB-1243]]MBD2307780.1 PD-(D/E)XK nuclease family protein [Chroococcidiopsis sp. [FACHB-1243]]